MQPDLPSIRQRRFRLLRSVFGAATKRGFRVIHFSAQSNHFHLVIEADDREQRARGMQGLMVRIARRINRVLGRRGRVFTERYHARALSSPRSVRNALVYVLQNYKKHRVQVQAPDPCSSGLWFGGWKDAVAQPPTPPPVPTAQTWLAKAGWKRHGLIGLDEAPRAPA
ncbi:MAG TPA: transposase [Polyangia bacterium]|nr:transposase [Polyangia bacterium]